jgi:N-glycosylase/DNA lyase
MFLRNIGFSLDLAVIDVHVLRYLAATSDWAVPSASEVSSLKRYEMVEERFQQLAKALGTRPGYLDTAVWVVMRTLRREEPRWVS